MKRDPYRDRAEKDRKEIQSAKPASRTENSQQTAHSRVELHGKKREEKKSGKKPFPLTGLLLATFIVLPLTVVLAAVYLFSDNETGITNATLENANEFQIEKMRETALSDKTEPVIAEENNDSASEEITEEASEEALEEEPADQTEEEPAEQPVEQPVEEPAEEVEQPAEEPAEPAAETPEPSGSTHTVQANETLYRISVNYGLGPDGVEQLKQINGLGNNEIYVGQVLQLP
ncbi:LysM peptidoglycan-binding domain-containing protein [Jeotgalibacillus terrae]|uniref:LysM peptidoglycan-binding domain-containing protein n=1 Tax=Jeotgalibacillus terrae TaxID=587735 RepID=A0ABW5ZMA5_9BACL|nr:LysM peptidoglycan-binding domain-containing protein [Jeotgalibacillus terrae]MBM7577461.1 cytoskeletal protein RodZ [Jeotgalibacillus terrae]